MNNADIGFKIRSMRLKRGISQTHIEEILNKRKGWLSRRERGNATITAKDLVFIFAILNESVDMILQY